MCGTENWQRRQIKGVDKRGEGARSNVHMSIFLTHVSHARAQATTSLRNYERRDMYVVIIQTKKRPALKYTFIFRTPCTTGEKGSEQWQAGKRSERLRWSNPRKFVCPILDIFRASNPIELYCICFFNLFQPSRRMYDLSCIVRRIN